MNTHTHTHGQTNSTRRVWVCTTNTVHMCSCRALGGQLQLHTSPPPPPPPPPPSAGAAAATEASAAAPVAGRPLSAARTPGTARAACACVGARSALAHFAILRHASLRSTVERACRPGCSSRISRHAFSPLRVRLWASTTSSCKQHAHQQPRGREHRHVHTHGNQEQHTSLVQARRAIGSRLAVAATAAAEAAAAVARTVAAYTAAAAAAPPSAGTNGRRGAADAAAAAAAAAAPSAAVAAGPAAAAGGDSDWGPKAMCSTIELVRAALMVSDARESAHDDARCLGGRPHGSRGHTGAKTSKTAHQHQEASTRTATNTQSFEPDTQHTHVAANSINQEQVTVSTQQPTGARTEVVACKRRGVVAQGRRQRIEQRLSREGALGRCGGGGGGRRGGQLRGRQQRPLLRRGRIVGAHQARRAGMLVGCKRRGVLDSVAVSSNQQRRVDGTIPTHTRTHTHARRHRHTRRHAQGSE